MIPGVGEQFRQFRILSKAGEGGMGVVFRADDTKLGREVALNHPNIVTIYDLDEPDGEPYLVLEWVSGTSLDRAPLTKPLGEEEFLRIARFI